MSGSQDPRAEGKSGRLRAGQIIRAAVALIDTDGIGQLTMRRLGDALGVEAMAVYRYFPSRRALVDALVESTVTETATDPGAQLHPDDDWRDYLDRIAHGVRQMALAHPRLFPLIATHPTEAPWIRPPIRSVQWVDAFLGGLQDHHFPPPAAVDAYKQFSTFLLGHLLLEVSSLGLDHPDIMSVPASPPDRDKQAAVRLRTDHAEAAAEAMAGKNAPNAEEIMDSATARLSTGGGEFAVQVMHPDHATADATTSDVQAVAADVDLPPTEAVVATGSISLSDYPHVAAMAGLLAEDTALPDFERGLDQLLKDLGRLRRP
ncbi:MAG: TetR/AcrR family transcriptional regulator [Mycobacteriales bacterium]